jgi:uncharacterized protein (DUF427 family)
MKVIPDPIGPGQESVWSYPRPPVAEPSQRRLKIVHRGVIIADTRKGIRTPEPAIPPTSYFPPADIAPSVLQPSRRRCFCEWKGRRDPLRCRRAAKRCAMWPGAIPIRTRPSDPCAITWPFTRGLSTAALSMARARRCNWKFLAGRPQRLRPETTKAICRRADWTVASN